MSNILIYEEYSSVLHGNQKYILLLCNYLPAYNINLSVAVNTKGPLSRRAAELVLTDAFCDADNHMNLFMKFMWLRKIMKQKSIKIVFCNNERSFLVAKLASLGLNIKFIWYIKNAFVFWPTDLFGAVMSDKVLAISNILAGRKGKAFSWLVRNKLASLPIGIPQEQFLSVPCTVVDASNLRVLISAALTPMKGFDDFFEALKLLDKKAIKMDVRVVGATPSGQQVYAEVLLGKAKALKNISVEFLGWKKNIASQLSWAHVNVLPSLSEGVPRSIIEAMAAGRAIVATDVGGVKEVVPVTAGIVVPAQSPEDLARALEKLNFDRELMVSMGSAGRDFVRSRYTIESHVNHLIVELNKLG